MPKKRAKRKRRSPAKKPVFSQEYRQYVHPDNPIWKAYCENIKRFWSYRCAICYKRGPLAVHHRTYERLGNELLTDCIPICFKGCHNMADKRRRMAAKKET